MSLTSWLRSRLDRITRPTSPRTTRPRVRLAFEQLEDRLTPAVSFDSGSLTSYASLTGDPNTPYISDYFGALTSDQASNRYVYGWARTADLSNTLSYIQKINADNSTAWVTTIGTNSGGPFKLTVDPSGNVYAAIENGGTEIIKLDPSGAVQGPRYAAPGLRDLATDATGALYYTGPGTVKLDWSGSIPVKVDEYAVGGDALAVSPDGSRVYVTGIFEGTRDFDPTQTHPNNIDILTTQRLSGGRWDVQVWALDLARNPATGTLGFQWVGMVGVTGTSDFAGDIAVDGSGVYIHGAYQGGGADFDPGPNSYSLPPDQMGTGGAFLVKLDVNDQFLWARGLAGIGGTDYPGEIALDAEGSVYVSGRFNGTACDFDIEHSYPGDIDLRTLSGGTVPFLAKFSPSGAFRWGVTVAGANPTLVGFAVAPEEAHFVVGIYGGTATVTPGGAQFTSDAHGNLLHLAFTQTADPVMVSIDDVSITEGNAGTKTATFTVSLSDPSDQTVTVNYATADGTATTADNDYLASSDTLTFSPGQTSKPISITLNGDIASEPNETFFVNLSGATNATLADVQGIGTLLDDDSTKFFVVDDASTDRTYRYGALGNAGGNSTLTSGNTAPRGAASNTAGTTVWVVDANKKVYVYNSSGDLLGSWTAGGLPGNAQVEGIAVDPNGNDLWLVDNKQDKVFKYTGAATLTSGSQNAASSFTLASGNTSPRDIVTDGTSLWVVNDAGTDKVFKYTLAGSLLGSWALTAGGGSPTGITLDPSAPAHLWIVDSGSDRVYQYDNAVGRTAGSQSASINFALAAGNTNPQGIADPPPAAAPPDDQGEQGGMDLLTVIMHGGVVQETMPTGMRFTPLTEAVAGPGLPSSETRSEAMVAANIHKPRRPTADGDRDFVFPGVADRSSDWDLVIALTLTAEQQRKRSR